LWIYSGYEQLSTVTEEIEEPERTFPAPAGHRCALGYDHVLPACRFSSKRVGKLANLANRLHGGSGAANGRAVAAMDYVRGCRSCTFVLLGSTILSATRLPFTMSQDGYFHPLWPSSAPVLAHPPAPFFCRSQFARCSNGSGLTQLIAVYAWLRAAASVLTLLSVWRLRKSAPDLNRPFLIPGGKIGLLAVVVIPIMLFGWALINSDAQARIWDRYVSP